MDLTASHDTLLKKAPVPGAELAIGRKSVVSKGKKYVGAVVLGEKDAHTQVELPYGQGKWWLYNGHWSELKGEPDQPAATSDGGIRLSVPYFNQVDNYTQPYRSCNSSSCAMCLAFFRASAIKGDDEYLRRLITGCYGDTMDHGAQTRLLKDYGLRSTWHTNLDFADLETELRLGRPIVIGILHRGSLSAPTGGHMCVVIGMTPKGDFIVNDPYGSCNDAYSGPVSNGRGAVYSRSMLKARWTVEGPNSGWGRKFQP